MSRAINRNKTSGEAELEQKFHLSLKYGTFFQNTSQ
jgi:hypothetical protein